MKDTAIAHEEITKLARATGRLPRPIQQALQEQVDLEPIRTLMGGTRIAPVDDLTPIIIHVDSLRMRANRELRGQDPIIRLIVGDEVLHARKITIEGPSELAEDYEHPLHDRPSAICVLKTHSVVRIDR